MTQTASQDVRTAIEAANEKFVAAFNSGDAAGVAALYTEQGQLLPPNSDVLTGHQAIQGFWQAVMDMGIKKASLEVVETEDFGETATEVSKYTLFDQAGQELDQGKYIIIWKQEGGEWRLHRDIFNSSLPTPG